MLTYKKQARLALLFVTALLHARKPTQFHASPTQSHASLTQPHAGQTLQATCGPRVTNMRGLREPHVSPITSSMRSPCESHMSPMRILHKNYTSLAPPTHVPNTSKMLFSDVGPMAAPRKPHATATRAPRTPLKSCF